MKSQYSSIILTEPVNLGIRKAEKGNWRYLRVKFRLWARSGSPHRELVKAASYFSDEKP
jgi:hypothetical protein